MMVGRENDMSVSVPVYFLSLVRSMLQDIRTWLLCRLFEHEAGMLQMLLVKDLRGRVFLKFEERDTRFYSKKDMIFVQPIRVAIGQAVSLLEIFCELRLTLSTYNATPTTNPFVSYFFSF